MQAAADTPFVAAVDLAEWLVERGMPFRQAHAVVGGLVRDAVERHVPLAELVEAHPALGAEAVELLAPGVAVTRRTTPGGAGPGPVAVQLERFAGHLQRQLAGLDRAPGPDERPGGAGSRRARAPGRRPGPVRSPAAGAGTDSLARSTTPTPSRWRRGCSTSWSGPPTAGPGGSSRWRPTTARRTRPATPSGARRPATAVMYGPPGHLYVYFSYGVHWCANVVCGPAGEAQAVLLRALEPVAGLELMRRARWRDQRHQDDRDLCRGPGRLCQALGIDRSLDGADLTAAGAAVWLADDGYRRPSHPLATGRVGISVAADRLWRFAVDRVTRRSELPSEGGSSRGCRMRPRRELASRAHSASEIR